MVSFLFFYLKQLAKTTQEACEAPNSEEIESGVDIFIRMLCRSTTLGAFEIWTVEGCECRMSKELQTMGVNNCQDNKINTVR